MRHAHIPYKKVTDMHLWQLCHLAMVVPIADAYYESADPEKVEKEWKIMRKTAERLKRNFNFLLFAIVISDDYAGSYIWKQFWR